jgi:diaminopimelate decarboxylase
MRVKVDIEKRARDVAALRPRLLRLSAAAPTPLYIFDPDEVTRNLRRFVRAFAAAGVAVRVFYAVKSNPYLGLLRTVVGAGHGIDVSSPRELRLALRAGARRVVFTGPAKRPADLELILRHRRRVVAHLESPRELEELARLAEARRCAVRCGLRITTRHQRKWSKFGIPLDELQPCWRLARRSRWLRVAGLQFHSGTLSRPDPVEATLEAVGEHLRAALSPEELGGLEFVDVGGGVPPEAYEGIYPWNREQTMSFDRDPDLVPRILADAIGPHHEAAEVVPVERFAARIAAAYRRHIAPLNPRIALCAEPGKFISHSAMHLLFRVADVKGPQAVIVDGGTNMIGWEKYEFFDYAPIFNLTRFAPRRERPTLVYGSLCTPHDLWGYYLRGRSVRVGDLLCMPFQGAYTYTLAQRFIRPVPAVVELTR